MVTIVGTGDGVNVCAVPLVPLASLLIIPVYLEATTLAGVPSPHPLTLFVCIHPPPPTKHAENGHINIDLWLTR
jgi:hypothetical protein